MIGISLLSRATLFCDVRFSWWVMRANSTCVTDVDELSCVAAFVAPRKQDFNSQPQNAYFLFLPRYDYSEKTPVGSMYS